MVNKIPKLIKFNYRNIEIIWVRVVKFENNYYYGHIDNKPISKGIKYNQYIKVHRNKVVETQYLFVKLDLKKYLYIV